MTDTELAAYIKSLKLTAKQKRFCEAYVLAPSNGAAAARKANPKLTPQSGPPQAWRWLQIPKVKAYIEVLRSGAKFQAAERAKDAEIVGAVSTTAVALARTIEILTEQAEGRLAWEEHETDFINKDGAVSNKVRKRIINRGAAVSKLHDHYAPRDDQQQGNRTVVINMLQSMPAEVLVPKVLDMIRGGKPRPQREG